MAVFSQIKNFFKNSNNYSPKYETGKRIVQKEKAKNAMPQFPGLEGYRLTAKLGDGAFSKVYEAIVLDSKEKVAIKVVRKAEINSHQKKNVLKEAQMMKTFENLSIIELLDFKETNEYFFLILELCEGGELFHQIVRYTYLSEDLSRHIIKQVANGIRYLHKEKGIVHRDIKPENLLIIPIGFINNEKVQHSKFDESKEDEGKFVEGLGGGRIGKVKIADFGLSKQIWDQQTRTPCGTVGYTAPEIINDRHYSVSVDMWALGCVLYTLLCGFPPFYDEKVSTLTEKVAKGQYTFLSPWWDDISLSAKDLITNLLCVDPRKRYNIDQFFAHPWIEKKSMDQTTNDNVKTKDADQPAETMPQKNINNNSEKKQYESEAEFYKRMVLDKNKHNKNQKVAIPSSEIPSVFNNRVNPAIESGSTTPRRDLVSDVSSMKEMFDISYKVHRIAEEKPGRSSLHMQKFHHDVISLLSEKNEASAANKGMMNETSSFHSSASEERPLDKDQFEILEKKLRAISDHTSSEVLG